MKNLFLSILAIVTLTLVSCGGTETKKAATGEAAPTASAAQASASKAISNAPVMSFDKGIHDFGVIQEGSRVETVFTFTNTGKSDLIIQDARGSLDVQYLNILRIYQSHLVQLAKSVYSSIQVTSLTYSKKLLQLQQFFFSSAL